VSRANHGALPRLILTLLLITWCFSARDAVASSRYASLREQPAILDIKNVKRPFILCGLPVVSAEKHHVMTFEVIGFVRKCFSIFNYSPYIDRVFGTVDLSYRLRRRVEWLFNMPRPVGVDIETLRSSFLKADMVIHNVVNGFGILNFGCERIRDAISRGFPAVCYRHRYEIRALIWPPHNFSFGLREIGAIALDGGDTETSQLIGHDLALLDHNCPLLVRVPGGDYDSESADSSSRSQHSNFPKIPAPLAFSMGCVLCGGLLKLLFYIGNRGDKLFYAAIFMGFPFYMLGVALIIFCFLPDPPPIFWFAVGSWHF
jgi:hypothetical protein